MILVSDAAEAVEHVDLAVRFVEYVDLRLFHVVRDLSANKPGFVGVASGDDDGAECLNGVGLVCPGLHEGLEACELRACPVQHFGVESLSILLSWFPGRRLCLFRHCIIADEHAAIAGFSKAKLFKRVKVDRI